MSKWPTEYSYRWIIALLVLPHVRSCETVLSELVEGRFLGSRTKARPYDRNACCRTQSKSIYSAVLAPGRQETRNAGMLLTMESAMTLTSTDGLRASQRRLAGLEEALLAILSCVYS